MDIGYDSERGLQCIVNFLRNEPDFTKKAMKIRKMTFKHYIKNNTSLVDANKYGFTNLDLLNERITWDTLRSKFAMEDILQFGVNFDIAIQIGLRPSYFGGDAGLSILKQMGATNESIKTVVHNLRDIKNTAWSPATVKDAGFEINDLLQLGNVANEMKGVWTIKQLVLAYRPDANEWVKLGFKHFKEGWDEQQYNTFVKPITKDVQNTEQDFTTYHLDVKENKTHKDYILKIEQNKLDLVKF